MDALSVPATPPASCQQRSADAPAASSGRIRIFIVDDHPLMWYALRTFIATQSDMVVCGEADDAASGLPQIFALLPNVVLVDISLRGGSGIDVMEAVRTSRPEIRIIAISMYPEAIYGPRALNAGACGYCAKHEAPERLVAAIRRVHVGGISISPELADCVVRRASAGRSLEGSPAGVLSQREAEVVELLGSGMTTREIAFKLHLSVKTIETHRAHIREKLGAKNATQLVLVCTQWAERLRSQGAAILERA